MQKKQRRRIMNKRKGILEELRQNKSENSKYKLLAITMQRYYKIYDMDCGTNFCDIFTALYLEKTEVTYDEIALRFGVSIPTLSRYIKQFNVLAEKLLNKINI